MIERKVPQWLLNVKEQIEEKNDNLYYDINYINNRELRISLDKENTSVTEDEDQGIKLRIWDGEKWHEFGTTQLEEKELLEAYERLKLNASSQDLEQPLTLNVDTTEIKKEFLPSTECDIETTSLEIKKQKLEQYKNRISQIDTENITNVRVVLIEEVDNHAFVNKHKELFQSIPLLTLVLAAYVKCEDGMTRMVYETFCDASMHVFEKAEHLFSEFERSVHNIKKAKKLDGGNYTVVFSPRLSGLLAHESFGHGMEADTMMKDRALASDWMGKQVGSSLINIVDYANVKGKHGQGYFDWEGNLADKRYLVKNGVLNKPMADLYSKSKLQLDAASNGRSESFDHKTYTRMSNTYFEPGDKKVEELFSAVEDGIYVESSGGGMEDPKGWGVQLQDCFGQRIKNGKLTDEFFSGFAVTGFLPDIMKNVAGISDELILEGTGFCGKGHKEWVRVSEGGPYLLINGVVLG